MGRLFWKFLAGFWATLLVVGFGVGAGVWFHNQADPDPALSAGPRAAFLVKSTGLTLSHGGLAALKQLCTEWEAGGGTRVLAVDADGRDILDRPVPAEALAEARRVADLGGERPVAQQVDAPAGGSYLLFVPADAGRPAPPRKDAPPPWLPLLVGGIASLAFAALLAWYVARPIRHLRAAFDAAASGRLDTRVGQRMGSRRDEIADLSRDFDRMAAQLQQLVEAQKRLLHDLSHEFRSPLARLQVAIGLARQNPDRSLGAMDRIELESQRLDHLVGEILTLARLDAPGPGLAAEEVDLTELIEAVVDDARFEAAASGRELSLANEAGRVSLAGHGEWLHRALDNVVRNAVQHSEGPVAVSLERLAPDRVRVRVADSGAGVPEEQMESIFEPFFRGGGGGGYGLGLAIARRAVEAHGGRIEARNRPGGGLEMVIELPG